jgi:hypothetical protein
MVPIDHARLHARDWGGEPEDYLPLDEFLDQTKMHCEDFRHRAILHSTLGVGLAEQVLGITICNRDGKHIPIRELARRHIRQDCGVVPTVKEWLDALSNGTSHRFNRPSRTDLKWLKENYYSEENESENEEGKELEGVSSETS